MPCQESALRISRLPFGIGVRCPRAAPDRPDPVPNYGHGRSFSVPNPAPALPAVSGEPAAPGRYEAVIGIEVHSQLKTASKMFCSCSTAYDGAPPNTHVCPVCLGLPGALPTINARAVEHVLTTGAAIEASAPAATRWDRKNYFYPDLPKGYQISQYDLPLASRGRLTFDTSDGPFTVTITRAHLEEDTAKLVHATDAAGRRVSLVDFNRSGAPLMEIVTEPDIRTAEQARRYAEELQLLLRSIGASDADMERGQLRVEANVSLRPRGTEPFGTRVEVKNMNSFRAVERAIAFEIERQATALDAGEAIVQETRGWSEERGSTYRMRVKETSDDYRYFPEPDLPPLHLAPEWLEQIRARLPELPAARRRRYREVIGLSPYDAGVLVADPDATALFEATLAADPGLDAKPVANWVLGEYLRLRNAADGPLSVDPAELGAIVRTVVDGSISRAQAREVLAEHVAGGGSAVAIIAARGFRQITDDDALGVAVDAVLAENAAAVADYRAGKAQAVGFLVGQVMKATRGQANAAMVQAAVRGRLDSGERQEG
jgi:aspartyl-tRNA(Asn)/glutamyl-tRNA(Gln) amidotransferase subunit B